MLSTMPRPPTTTAQPGPAVPVTIRFPRELHDRLTRYAQDHARTFSAQLLYWLAYDVDLAERGEHPLP
jgi:hypothetical protein